MGDQMTEYDFTGLTSSSRELLIRGGSIEDVLRHLRDDGVSPVASMKVLRDLIGISVTDAKDIVLSSDAWADKKPEFDQSAEILADFLKETDSNKDGG
jgi:hypothetical protein